MSRPLSILKLIAISLGIAILALAIFSAGCVAAIIVMAVLGGQWSDDTVVMVSLSGGILSALIATFLLTVRSSRRKRRRDEVGLRLL